MPEGFIPPHGGYRKLLSYQRAEIVYDATVHFCARYFDKRDRTVDQMVQAARSGKQNIIEGSMASATSKESEIKLTNVARASLEELLADYRDFLRIRGLEEWAKDHPYARRLGELIRTPNATYDTFRKGLEHQDPAIAANVIIGLIKVASTLLDKQLRQLEKAFVEEGGLRERMTAARLKEGARRPSPRYPDSPERKPKPPTTCAMSKSNVDFGGLRPMALRRPFFGGGLQTALAVQAEGCHGLHFQSLNADWVTALGADTKRPTAQSIQRRADFPDKVAVSTLHEHHEFGRATIGSEVGFVHWLGTAAEGLQICKNASQFRLDLA